MTDTKTQDPVAATRQQRHRTDLENILQTTKPRGWWALAFISAAILVVGIMIPGGPGMTGTFELALAAGFSLLLLSPESQGNITLYTIMLHVSQLVVQVACGVPYLLMPHRRLTGAVGVDDDDGETDSATGAPPG